MSDPMAELLIGVDLGTTGTKTALYEPGGRPLATATAHTPLRWQGPGEVEQDPEDFVATATATIAQCVREAGVGADDVAGIGITGQMAGTMAIDSAWRPATPYDSWLDTRCADDVRALEAEVGDELVALAGCPAMVNHAPKIRWWRRNRPREFADAAAWMPPSSFVAGRLAGLDAGAAFVDRTYLHFTGLADARAGAWSDELADAVGVPRDRLPRIVEPTEVVGEFTAEAASACGLRPGTPVAAGLGDTAATVLGAGVVRPGQLLDAAGTAACLCAGAEEFRPDVEHRTLIVMRGALSDQWVSLGYLTGGATLPWLARLFGEEDEAEAFRRVTGEAARAPAGSDGLLFVPHLDGRILPSDPTLRGAWVGLHHAHERRHLCRAVLESVALEYAGYLRVLAELHPGLRLDEARVAGGGARSAVWNGIKASTLGVPFATLDRDELGCWGAALCAGAAVGVFDSLADAADRTTRVRARVEPDPARHEVYSRLEPIYRDLTAALSESCRKLGAIGAPDKEVVG
jgi:xylulokinase